MRLYVLMNTLRLASAPFIQENYEDMTEAMTEFVERYFEPENILENLKDIVLKYGVV